MTENNICNGLNEKILHDCVRSLLSYFNVSHIYGSIDVQPGRDMINVRVKETQAEGIYHVLKSAFKSSPQRAFLGKSPEQRALVRQWVDFNLCYVSKNILQTRAILRELELALSGYTFFAGHSVSVCDVLFYHTLYPTYQKMTFEEKELYPSLSRWFALLQEDKELRKQNSKISFSRILLYNN